MSAYTNQQIQEIVDRVGTPSNHITHEWVRSVLYGEKRTESRQLAKEIANITGGNFRNYLCSNKTYTVQDVKEIADKHGVKTSEVWDMVLHKTKTNIPELAQDVSGLTGKSAELYCISAGVRIDQPTREEITADTYRIKKVRENDCEADILGYEDMSEKPYEDLIVHLRYHRIQELKIMAILANRVKLGRTQSRGIELGPKGEGLLRQTQAKVVRETLLKHNGNKTRAAKELGITGRTLRNWLRSP